MSLSCVVDTCVCISVYLPLPLPLLLLLLLPLRSKVIRNLIFISTNCYDNKANQLSSTTALNAGIVAGDYFLTCSAPHDPNNNSSLCKLRASTTN
uniref:Uncharacterized protein n=1 Tax=Glossina palpalis gambiensis TaxID=67801 RepID=A0A1B0ARF9_9MUSC